MGDLRLREVTPVSCAAFLATLADRPATHAKVRSRLQGILQAGVRLDLFETNPASATKPPKRTFTPREMTLEEVRGPLPPLRTRLVLRRSPLS